MPQNEERILPLKIEVKVIVDRDALMDLINNLSSVLDERVIAEIADAIRSACETEIKPRKTRNK